MEQDPSFLTKEQAQFILASMDTHVRNNGLGVASMALMVAAKLTALTAQAQPPEPKDKSEG